MKDHFINQEVSLLEALARINTLGPEPLVQFVMDNNSRMVGTLTDGDSRRALVAGSSINDPIEKIMHKSFNYMKVEDLNNVKEIKRQRDLKMRMVPILDKDKPIV